MKRLLSLFCFALVLLPAACGVEKQEAAPDAPAAPTLQLQGAPPIVDHKAAVIGGKLPAWVEYAVYDDYGAIAALPEFKGRTPFIMHASGADLEITQAKLDRNMEAGIALMLRQTVAAKFSYALNGNDRDKIDFVNSMIATFSERSFSGLRKDKDYWIKRRIQDGESRSHAEYVCYQLSSIDENYLRAQLDEAIGRIPARTQEEKAMINDLKEIMDKAEYAHFLDANESR
ncbi:MAG: hypothetical protein LBQ63_03940 [Deltaproteobacteria bacterium]|jgi:hypothetical protein|nr:hypothetical protein [Deltaproteobacteria bacterium]